MSLPRLQGFGDYELREEIARGGMGVVFRAWQKSLGREVAIKMTIAGELTDDAALRMFRTEAQAAANLHHPNIVPVYEIGEHDMHPYFAMRLVPGGQTIAKWARQHQGEWRTLASATAKVARAVQHAHDRGVLHRDLKPSNILWDPGGEPQVTDFGLAKILNSADGSVTKSAVMFGSPSYMAPEQASGKLEEITTATDVYGIGAVLYELLSGRQPFVGGSVIDIARQVVENSPPPLSRVPVDISTVCLKCLSKRPEDRYPTAAALADDLERFARGEPVTALPLASHERLWRWAQRKPKQAFLVLLCALSMFSGVVGVAWQWRKTNRANAAQAKALAHLQWQEIGRWLEDGSESRALAYLSSLIRKHPERWQPAMYAMSIVDQHSFPVLAGPEIHPPAKLQVAAHISPDGRSVVAAGVDRMVREWDVATGEERAQWPQSSPVTALAISDSPARVAITSKDGAVTVRTAASPTPVSAARLMPSEIEDLRFSANGAGLVARSKPRVEVWVADAVGALPQVFELKNEINGAEISADARRLLYWSATQAVVADLKAGRELLRVSAVQKFRHGTLAAGGGRFALMDGETALRVWDVESGHPFRDIIATEGPVMLALDCEGDRLTTAGSSNHLIVFDVESGLKVSPTMQHHYSLNSLKVSLDGRRTVSYGDDDVASVWDARNGRAAMSAICLGGARQPGDIDLSRDGTRVLVHIQEDQGSGASISVWTGTAVHGPKRHSVEGQLVSTAQISPSGLLGALGLEPENRCQVYELNTGRVLLDKRVNGEVYVHLFSPDGGKYYALTANGWLHGWSLQSGEELWPPRKRSGNLRPAAISPDGSRIIAGYNDGHIRVYDTATGQQVQVLDHPGEVKLLRFSRDGSGRFLSGSTDKLAHVWDLQTGTKLQTFAGHSQSLIAGDWSPDNRYIATASYDGTSRVWDVASGQAVGVPMSHFTWLSHLQFSPDGTTLATACRDGNSRLWNPLTGLPQSALLNQGQTCETVRFTRDGRAFIVRDHDGFRFWDAETAEPVSIHYVEPLSSGIGMDSENYRAIMTADGTQVFLGHSMKDTALWTISQPRGRAPAWFPGFLETLAHMKLDRHGEIRLLPRGQISRFETEIQRTPADEIHAAWARNILNMPAIPSKP